jgi:hypothetical protein
MPSVEAVAAIAAAMALPVPAMDAYFSAMATTPAQ